MTNRLHSPDQDPLFHIDPPPPAATPDIVAISEHIARVAGENGVVDYNKPPNAVQEDLGWRGRETLATDVPFVPRAKPAGLRARRPRDNRESPFTDIGSDTRDSDPSLRPVKDVLEGLRKPGEISTGYLATSEALRVATEKTQDQE